MSAEMQFKGFPRGAIRFLEKLDKNNDKQWFAAHRDEYDENILAPSRAFVVAMGARLSAISPGIMAEPRVNGSLFRIHRDTRFSKDKRPYKTNVGIFFWEGGGKRMECPGFYFHLQPPSLMLGTGIYLFPKELLEVYRQAVVDPKLGPALAKAVKKVGPAFARTGCGMSLNVYKKVPRGYDPEHPRAELLKYKGLHAGFEVKVPRQLHSPKLVDYCFERWSKLAPLHFWLLKMLASR